MNHGMVLAALPNREEEAKSMKEIAQAIGLEISTHSNWIRAERRLARYFWQKWASIDYRIAIGSEPKGGLLDH